MSEPDFRLQVIETDIKEIKARLVSVERQNAIDEVHRSNVEKRLSGIEDTLRWLVKIILGAIVLGLISFILSGGIYVP